MLLREREVNLRQITDLKDQVRGQTDRIEDLEHTVQNREQDMQDLLVEMREERLANARKFDTQQANIVVAIEALTLAMNDLLALRRDYTKMHDTVFPKPEQ